MKPLIGVTASQQDRLTTLKQDNWDAIESHSGIPVVLSNLSNDDDIKQLADTIDGLYLTGGGDIDPTYFGEEPHNHLGNITPERDYFEIKLSREMMRLDKPILAVCRGCQILNIAASGDMYQDIYSQMNGELLQHSQNAPTSHASHFVEIDPVSKLYQILRADKIKVNSFHHQSVRNMGQGFQVTGVASDGVIEAFESRVHRFVLGIQWHPECLLKASDPNAHALFSAFLKACK